MMVQSEHILVLSSLETTALSTIQQLVVVWSTNMKINLPQIGNVVPTFEDTNNFINNSANSKGGEIQAITTANAFFEVEICFY